jgi:hypothetical protein
MYFGPSGTIGTQLAYSEWSQEYLKQNAGAEIQVKLPPKVTTWAGLLAWWLEECRRDYVRLRWAGHRRVWGVPSCGQIQSLILV